jgi:hypothetical protein
MSAASGQVPKRADATTSSGFEGIPAAVACVSTGSLGPAAVETPDDGESVRILYTQ